MEQERRHNIAVGLTTLAGLVGLLALLFLFGYVPSFAVKGYTIRIYYPQAAGIHAGSPVRLNGIDIGKVDAVWLEGPPRNGVAVVARILNDELDLPKGTDATVSSNLLSGASSVELSIDEAEVGGPKLAKDGSAEIDGRIDSVTGKLDALAGSIGELASEWKALGTNLRTLTEPRTPGQVDAGEAPGNLASILARADQRLVEMKQAIENINAWAGDKQLREDFKTTLANAKETTANFDDTVARLEKRVVALADDLSKTNASIQDLLTAAKEGDGTVGKLLSDPALYNNLNDTAERLKIAVDEARLLIEKWKKEGVPVQF